jgi:hypothetical protein
VVICKTIFEDLSRRGDLRAEKQFAVSIRRRKEEGFA